MTILPKTIYRFSAIPIKLPMTFFTEIEQKVFKFVWKHKRPQIAKAIFRKKNGAGGIRQSLPILWEDWTAKSKRMKLEHSLTPHTNIKSKWIKDLNVRLDTIKLFEENIGRTLFDVNRSNIFLDPPPRVMKIKTKINNGA